MFVKLVFCDIAEIFVIKSCYWEWRRGLLFIKIQKLTYCSDSKTLVNISFFLSYDSKHSIYLFISRVLVRFATRTVSFSNVLSEWKIKRKATLYLSFWYRNKIKETTPSGIKMFRTFVITIAHLSSADHWLPKCFV